MLREKLSQVYDEASSLNNENKVWLEEPVDFKTFNESIDYLNAFPLSDRQYRDIYNTIGKDPKKIFNQERQNDLGVLLWGKGSGKDLSVARVFNYLFYILLCMLNAQEYLWLTDRTTHMDIINVAKKGEQARKIFFSYFIHILKTAPWFRSHFILRESNKIISKPANFKSRDTIEIGSSSVIATNANIRAFAETSANESYEGYNIAAWCMDEASAFKSKAEIENAYDIYKTLKTSGSSRASKNFKPIGFVISYPRQAEGDITVDMYNASLRSTNIYGSFGWSWQIKPAHLYSGKTFPFTHKRIGKFLLGENISATIQVPVELKKDFYDDFLNDASDALCKHFCIPPSTTDQWAIYPELFYSCVTQGNSIVEFSQDVIREWNEEEKKEERRIVLRFHKLNITFTEAKHKQYVLWFDNAEVNCDACIAIGHIENYNGLSVLIQDANIVWSPNPEMDLKVSLLNVEQWITDILPKQLNLVAIGFDAWNTLALKEKLRTNFPNIKVIQHNLNNQDYGFFEGLVYKNQVRTPFQSPIGQLVNLQKGNTVPKPKRGFFKDQADGLVGIAKLLLSDEAQKTSNLSTAPASVRTESLAAAPNLFREVNNPFAPQAMNSQQPVFEHRLVDIDSIRQMMGVNKTTSRTFSGSGNKSNVRRLPLSTKV